VNTQAADLQPSACDRILVAAAHLYAIRGYAGTSIREIAELAGVTKPLVYYHFTSKEGLYGRLFRHAMGYAVERAEGVLLLTTGAANRLRALIRAQLALARQAPEIYLFVHSVMTMPGLLPLGFDYKDVGRRYLNLFVGVVEEGQRSGEFRMLPPDLVVAAPLSALGIYVAKVLAGDLEQIPEDLDENLFDLIAFGVEARRG
jgi:AcrR family transcriptional regulator